MPREPEIAEFHDPIVAYQYVLGLHIPVGDPVRVQIVQCPDQLLRYFPDLNLAEILVILDDVKQLPPAQLGHHHKLRAGLVTVEQEHDVLVPEFLEDLYLLSHVGEILLCLASALGFSYFFFMVLMATICPVCFFLAL